MIIWFLAIVSGVEMLKQSVRTLTETSSLGGEVLTTLQTQRESLLRTGDKVREIFLEHSVVMNVDTWVGFLL
jgi:hypothetical protein